MNITEVKQERIKEHDKLFLKKVRVTHYLIRTTGDIHRNYRTWEKIPLNEPVEGYITGKRTLNEGYRNPGSSPSYPYYDDEGESPSFQKTGSIPCLLVTFHLRRNTLKVPLDSYELI